MADGKALITAASAFTLKHRLDGTGGAGGGIGTGSNGIGGT